jgi:hypothetical protein
MRLASSLAVCAVMLLVARGAPADQKADTARATIALGVTHAEAGRWEQALAAFEEAHRLDPQPSTLFNVAQARLQTHRSRAAVEAYQALLAMRSALPARQVEGAERGLAQARASIGRIAARTTADGALFVDDRPAGAGPVEVDPGPHVVRLVKNGHDVGLRRVVVQEGQALDVLVELDPVAPPPPSLVTPPPAQPESRLPVAAISLFGGGLVAGGIGAFFSVRGYTGWSDLKNGCSKTSSCDTGDIRDAQRDVLIGDVLIGVGIVAVAVGAYLLITSSSSQRSRDLAVRF